MKIRSAADGALIVLAWSEEPVVIGCIIAIFQASFHAGVSVCPAVNAVSKRVCKNFRPESEPQSVGRIIMGVSRHADPSGVRSVLATRTSSAPASPSSRCSSLNTMALDQESPTSALFRSRKGRDDSKAHCDGGKREETHALHMLNRVVHSDLPSDDWRMSFFQARHQAVVLAWYRLDCARGCTEVPRGRWDDSHNETSVYH